MNIKSANKLNLIFLIFISVILSSCHKDREELTLIDTSKHSPKVYKEYNGNLQVYVSDEEGNPVNDAVVTFQSLELNTNQFGIANFQNIPLDPNGSFVMVEKNNYAVGSDRFFPTGINNYAIIKLISTDNNNKTINPSTNITIEIDGGGRIEFQANSFQTQQGENYAGEVIVTAQRIGTDDLYLQELMPGNLIGIDFEGNTKVLGTYGMVYIEAKTSTGIKLSIDESKPARVYFPITDDLLSLAPEEIALWKFSFESGYWHEKSTAELIGSEYASEISELGYINCDEHFEIIDFTGQIVDINGTTVPKAKIVIKTAPAVYTGITNDEGAFGGKLPKNEELTIEIYIDACPEPIYANSFGPYQNDVELDIINLSRSVENISGSVDCFGIPAEGIVVIKSNESYTTHYTDENGQFSFKLNETICTDEPEVEIFGLDPSTNQISKSSFIDFNNNSPLTFEVCADCDYEVSIISEFSDACKLSTELTANVDNGSGNYTYNWSTGDDIEFINVNESGNYCVTIYDVIADCEKVECSDVTINNEISIDITKEDILCANNGILIANAAGGEGTLSFFWTGPNGFSADGTIIDGLSEPGTYVLEVVDMNGCVEESSIDLNLLSNVYDLTIVSSESTNVICGNEEHFLEVVCPSCPFDLSETVWTFPNGESFTGIEIEPTDKGIYEVNIVSGDCTGNGLFQMQKVVFEEINVEYVCIDEVNQLEVSGFSVDHSLEYIPPTREELINNYSEYVFQDFYIQSEYNSCEEFYSFQLPTVLGEITYNKTIPTCDLCENGSIQLDFANANFYMCDLGSVSIYAENDLDNDLSDENTESLLLKGNYYVVLKSTEGCIINSDLVEL